MKTEIFLNDKGLDNQKLIFNVVSPYKRLCSCT